MKKTQRSRLTPDGGGAHSYVIPSEVEEAIVEAVVSTAYRISRCLAQAPLRHVE